MTPLEEIAQFAQQVYEHRPIATRIDLGTAAHDRLIEHFRAQGNLVDPAPWELPPLIQSLVGIPVVKREDFEPDALRVLGRDGEVLMEGAL